VRGSSVRAIWGAGVAGGRPVGGEWDSLPLRPVGALAGPGGSGRVGAGHTAAQGDAGGTPATSCAGGRGEV